MSTLLFVLGLCLGYLLRCARLPERHQGPAPLNVIRLDDVRARRALAAAGPAALHARTDDGAPVELRQGTNRRLRRARHRLARHAHRAVDRRHLRGRVELPTELVVRRAKRDRAADGHVQPVPAAGRL